MNRKQQIDETSKKIKEYYHKEKDRLIKLSEARSGKELPMEPVLCNV